MRTRPLFLLPLSLFLRVEAIIVSGEVFSQTSYDYIVVGGGTTGLALASLLSKDHRNLVGVIEAGHHIESNDILIPGLIGSTLGDPSVDWLFSTVPQVNLFGRQLELGRGKCLGGTSALNFMAHTRASCTEYDGWGSLGNPGWNFSVIQEHIKQSENWTPPDIAIAEEFHANRDFANHGTHGSIRTASYTFYSDVVLPFFHTMNALGIPTNDQSNGGNPRGVFSVTATVDAVNRTRSYATTGYFEPDEIRQNFQVVTGAQVTEIILSKTPSGLFRATGVHAVNIADGSEWTAHATKEIILSAGSIGTPQLLELSGIGNSTLLTDLGIDPIIDLPGVGENLQDHPGIVVDFQALDNLTTFDELTNATFAAEEFQLYVENRTGMYSSTASTLAFLALEDFVPTNVLDTLKQELDTALQSDKTYNTSSFQLERSWMDDNTVPHLEMVLFPALTGSNTPAVPGKKYYTISFLLEHCWSRGTVHIVSNNGTAPPAIDLRYLSAPADIDTKVLVEAVKFALKLGATEPMAGITTDVLQPASNSTDADIADYLHHNLATNYHLIGTAAMLPRQEGGVVDSNLLVYGTTNLRVVDASIMPLQVAAHPSAALYGIAEKMAALIMQ